MSKILILHNEASPYRMPLFEKIFDDHDGTVYFCEKRSSNRSWEVKTEYYSFNKMFSSKKILKVDIDTKICKALIEEEFGVLIISAIGVKTIVQSIILVIYGILTNTKIIFWSGFVDTPFYRRKKPLKYVIGNLVRKLMVCASDISISYSKMNSDYLVELGAKRENIFTGTQVMPKSLLPDPKHKLIQERVSNNIRKSFNILYLGYLRHRKGVDLLIEAYKNIRTEKTNLIIAGDGEKYEQIKQKSTGYKDIITTGYVEGERKSSLYSIADLFVLPTRHDPWGLVVNEAIYYDIPIVVSEYAGSKEIVRQDDIVLNSLSVEQISEAITSMYSNRRSVKSRSGIHRERVTSLDIPLKTFEDAFRRVA